MGLGGEGGGLQIIGTGALESGWGGGLVMQKMFELSENVVTFANFITCILLENKPTKLFFSYFFFFLC